MGASSIFDHYMMYKQTSMVTKRNFFVNFLPSASRTDSELNDATERTKLYWKLALTHSHNLKIMPIFYSR